MGIAALLFDLDGVVIDSEPLYECVEKQLLQRYGIELDRQDYRNLKGLSEAAVFDWLERRFHPAWERAVVSRESRELLLREFQDRLGFMPGFEDLMNRLGTRYCCGLVTSTGPLLVEWIAARLGLRRYFREIVTAADTVNSKPHPQPYLAMMRRLEVPAERSVVIEDSMNGVRSGKAAGAAVIALTSTLDDHELQEADLRVPSLSRITPDLIESLYQAPDRAETA